MNDKDKAISGASKQVASPTGINRKGAIKVGIIGGAGYTGGELIRLLIHHPDVTISFIHSRSSAGKSLHSIHHDLVGETDLKFTDDNSLLNDGGIDILFLCVGHGEAKKFLEETNIADTIRIIDLSQDFRLHQKSTIANRQFVYGLPELNKEKIIGAQNVANPGCFATAMQLGLLPLAKIGQLKKVYATGITGSTGAGQSLSSTTHFSWRANNIQAYKTLTHQHLHEISQSLNQLQHGGQIAVNFVPWRGDFTRGIFISSQVECKISEAELNKVYEAYYKDHSFVVVCREPISLKQVVNTNKCVVQLEKLEEQLVIHSAIDNLLKGASGQAVQNMNLMFGLEETAGLLLKPIGF